MSARFDRFASCTDEDREALKALLGQCFAADPAQTNRWFEEFGAAATRLLLDADDRPEAGLMVLPAGQFLGGRRVSTVGIAGVGVRPDRRGLGLGHALMAETLREARAQGFVLSTLYASTLTLYRSVGFEVAGTRFVTELDLNHIDLKSRWAPTPITEADQPEVRALYQGFAKTRPGFMDRNEVLWRRATQDREGRPFSGYLWRDQAGVAAYLYYRQLRVPGAERFEMEVTDFALTTPESGRALWAFIAAHRSVVGKARLTLPPNDPMRLLLPEQYLETTAPENWMFRVVNLERALLERDYPQGLRFSVGLDVDDPLLPENQGRFTLTVEGGEARVTRGGNGEVKLPIRGLPPLLSGFASPTQLAQAGLLAGPEGALANLQAAFAGPAPFMVDRF